MMTGRMAGAVAGKVKVTLPPGGTRSSRRPLANWIVVAFSFVPVQLRVVGIGEREGGVRVVKVTAPSSLPES